MFIPERKRKELVMQVVDKTLVDILGNQAAHLIYDYLESRCNLKKEEIPFKTVEFGAELQKLLGDAARILMEKIEQDIKQSLES